MTQIPNPYKAALEQARPGVTAEAHALERALQGAMSAMAAGAWQSSVATEFEHGLKAKKSTLHTAGESAVQEINAKINSEHDMVDANSFQAHWAKFSAMARY
ncbi:hypothetical protein [uncultured Jatrophihabitans sp.]|uniref:hypothetical protein n=1 Tax=uncultured Jatrophihabitans sp. TaxID=1610747 RepID=UPI0035CB9FC9